MKKLLHFIFCIISVWFFSLTKVSAQTIIDFNNVPSSAYTAKAPPGGGAVDVLYSPLTISSGTKQFNFVMVDYDNNSTNPEFYLQYNLNSGLINGTSDILLYQQDSQAHTVTIKTADASTFNFKSFQLLDYYGNVNYTISGYNNNVLVTGAQFTITTNTTGAAQTIAPPNGNTAFNNVDEIRITADITQGGFQSEVDDFVWDYSTPGVTTGTASSITINGATLSGSVINTGGSAVTEKGIVYSTTANPTTSSGTKITNGSGTGAISAAASGLAASTIYHYRAYATNTQGNGYGADATFKTLTNVTGGTVPSNRTYKIGDVLSFNVNFSGPVYVTGTPQLSLTVGSATKQANYSGGSATNALTFTYTVASGDLDADGIVVNSLSLSGGTINDAASGGNAALLTLNNYPATNGILIDGVAPTATISSTVGASGSTTSSSPIPFSVIFSKAVTGFTVSDITVTNGTAGSLTTADNITYSFNVTPSANGSVTVSVAANAAQDAAGNGNTAASNFSINYTLPATAAPAVLVPGNGTYVSTTTPTYAGTATANATITLYVDATSIGTTTSNSSGNWAIVQPTSLSQGSHTVYATAQASGSSVSPSSNTNTFIVDSQAPSVTITSTAGSSGGTASTSPIPFTVTFSEAVTGFIVADITISNASISGFSGSGTTYTFNATPTGSSAVSISVQANVATDAAGNGNTASATYTLTPPPPSNQAPVLTTTGGSTNFSGSPVAIDNALTVSDVDNTTLSSATIVINGNFISGQDILAFTTNASLFGNIVGSYNAGTGVLTLTSSGATATVAQWQAALRSIAYNNSSSTPNTATRTISFTVNDGTANSNTATKNVTITYQAAVTSVARASSNPTNASNVQYTITFDKPVTGITISNFSITTSGLSGVGVSSVAGSGTTYTVTVNTGTGSGNLTLNLANGTGITPAIGTSLPFTGETYTIDKTAPTTTVASLALSADNGASSSDFITNVSSQTISGTLSANLQTGESVLVSADNGATYTTAVASVGSNSFSLSGVTLSGTNTIVVRVQDAVGNLGAARSQNYIIDTTAPSAPALLTVANGASINTSTPTYSGTAEANANVIVYVDNASIGSTTANGSGNWSYTQPTALSDGTHTAKATAIDLAGNTSTNSNTNTYTIDTTPPAAPVVTTPANGGATNNSQPTYTGTAEANSTVTVYVDGTSISTASANSSGNWSLTQQTPLSSGSHTVYATATDFAGNTSSASLTNNFTIDLTAPTVTSVTVPANGTYTAGQNLDFKINYSENVVVNTTGGTPYIVLQLDQGGNVPAYYVSGTNSNSLTFRYTVQSTDKDLTGILVGTVLLTNGGTIKDVPGNNANNTLNNIGSTTNVLVDGNPIVPQTITFLEIPPREYGEADFNPGAVSDNSGIPITYTSSNTSVATIVNGKIHIIAAGTSTITASQAGDATHSAAADKQQTLTVNAKAITVTANAQSKTYGDADPALTYTNSPSLVNGDTFSGSLTRAAGENVGTYAITQGSLALSNNYTLTYTGAELTIGKKTIAVTANAQSKTYGDADPALTYDFSPSLVNGDTFSGSLTRAAGENVGTYAITQGSLALSNNYTLTYTGADLTIGKKTIAVTANAQSKTYGDADPALTYTNSPALVNGDTFTGSLTRAAGENVGTYAITQGSLALSNNYTLTYTGADLTIGKKTIAVTANAQSKTYGDADPGLTYTNSPSLVNGDTFTGSLTRVAGENVGTYAITQGSLALSNNYTLTYTGADLTINKVAITVTANPQVKPFGQPDPALTYQITTGSLKFTDTFSGGLTRDAGENVGTYAIRQGTLTAGNNYTLTYVGASLTINPIERILTFNQLPVKTYGDGDFNPGARLNTNETVIYSSSNPAVATIVNGRIHITGAGIAAITASAPNNGNYNFTQPVTQQLVVNKANQIITFPTIPAQIRGSVYSLADITSNSGLPVAFTVSDKTIANIDGTNLKALAIGHVTLTVSVAGNDNYNPTSNSQNIEVIDNEGNQIMVRRDVSPNGDGIGDALYIEGITSYPNNTVTVVNRNGVKVFEVKRYDNVNNVFDGHSNITNQLQTPGTYFYVVQWTDAQGVGHRKAGYFVLKYHN